MSLYRMPSPCAVGKQLHMAIRHPVEQIIPCCHSVKTGSRGLLRHLHNVHVGAINKIC